MRGVRVPVTRGRVPHASGPVGCQRSQGDSLSKFLRCGTAAVWASASLDSICSFSTEVCVTIRHVCVARSLLSPPTCSLPLGVFAYSLSQLIFIRQPEHVRQRLAVGTAAGSNTVLYVLDAQ